MTRLRETEPNHPVLTRACCVIWCLGLLIVGGQAFAASGTAILLQGPKSGNGLLFLPANAIPYYYGEYQYGDETVWVYYTTTQIVPGASWKRDPCRELPMLVVPGVEDVHGDGMGVNRVIRYYDSGEGWYLFLSFPRSFADPCGFAARFVTRFRYFKQAADRATPAPFPAVLDLKS